MYPHVFLPHWIKGFWYNFLHPPLFCGTDKNWDGEGSCGLKGLGEGHMGWRFSRWGKRPLRTPWSCWLSRTLYLAKLKWRQEDHAWKSLKFMVSSRFTYYIHFFINNYLSPFSSLGSYLLPSYLLKKLMVKRKRYL